MLPTPFPYESHQQVGRNSNPFHPQTAAFELPGQTDYQPDDRTGEWSGSATRRSSTGDGEDGAGEGADSRNAVPVKKLSTVNRSAMACMLCRKQKMKCEGKDKAPCRRCRTAGVECTFEAAAPAPSGTRKGAAASKEWIETRMSGVEGRLKKLETRQSSISSASTMTAPPSPTINTSAEALEARIAQLEAQVYALTLAASSNASSVPPTPQTATFTAASHPQPRVPQHHYQQPSSFPTSYGVTTSSQPSYTLPPSLPIHQPHQQPHPSPAPTAFADFYPTPEIDHFHNSPPPLRDNFYAQYQPHQTTAYTSHPVDQQHQRWPSGGDSQRAVGRGGGP